LEKKDKKTVTEHKIPPVKKPGVKKSSVEKPLKKKTIKEETPAEKIPETVKPVTSKKDEYNTLDMIGILDKFRSKILVTLLMLVILTPVAFYFSDWLLYFINKPFIESGNKLNIFTLMGGFMLKFKVSVAAALFILAPVIIYQIWSIIVPSLNKSNRMFSRITIIAAVILFYSGVTFVFFILLPAAIKVMLSFVGKDMLSTIGADNYLGFILFFSLSMGVLFEVPVIVLVLTRMGIVSPAMLSKKRKYAIVVIWVIAAIITPQPDPLSQAMVGVPLMIIYEISIIISRIVARSNLKRISYR
jgi:sec-independent protein translocase protein TatC